MVHLQAAGEVLLTNSLVGVLPVTRIDEREIGAGMNAGAPENTERLREALKINSAGRR